MSGLKSLLKYRFQPRDTEKIEGSQETQNGNTTPEKNKPDNGTVPETPPSKLASPGSPVFAKGKKMIAAIDSSSDESSKSNSPWLSKANGIKTGAGVTAEKSQPKKRKYEPESPVPSSSSASSSQTNSQDENRSHELKQKVDSLKAMFPGCALWMLEDAAVASPDLDSAIDLIIARNRVGNTSRPKSRPSLNSQSSQGSTSSDIQPPAKRARPLLSDSSDAPNSQNSETGNGTDSQTPVTVTSPTENVGSIKAYKAARQATRIRRDLMNTDDEEEDEEESGPTEPKAAKEKGSEKSSDAAPVVISNVGDDDEGDEVELEESDSEEEEEKDSDPILDFFQNAELEELMSMPGCSKKKAETLIENRPYDNWENLMEKINNLKQLNFNLITGCKELLRIRSTVNRLMKHCEQIAQDMETIVSTLRNKTTLDDEERGCYITKQPSTLEPAHTLKPYQLVGLNWLTLMHRQELNGILADEMGLGKTIQTVAFLAQLLQDGEKGPHVIIAPSSTIDNWLRELRKWCPKLKVILYYGSQEERRDLRNDVLESRPGDFHVIVTSYNMATGGIEDRVMFKKCKFQYAIFDEGHMLKNMSSLRYQNLMKIKAQRRLLLTGTPLQNNLVELMSLLCFVMPEMFVGKTDHLKRMFTAITSGTKNTNESRGAYEKECVQRAKQILRPFFLRRIKSEVLKQLPQKIEFLEKVPMGTEQQALYDELRDSFTRRLETSSALDTDLKSRGASMLMELRKAANHHLLHRRHYTDATLKKMAPLMLKEPTHSNANVDYIFEDMQVMSDFELHRLCEQYKSIRSYKLDDQQVLKSGKFKHLDTLLDKLKEKGSRVLLFSQFTMMLDIIEIYMNERGHKFLRLDGSTPVAERQDMIDRFSNDPELFVFLLSTRAGGLGINLTAADTVVLHDIDFNPYNDKQAEDRCHRVGQTKDVSIHRLISKNTLEEAMYRCAQKKLQLEEDITGTGSKAAEESTGDVASLLKEALVIGQSK